jgi:CHAD domain-containing protein
MRGRVQLLASTLDERVAQLASHLEGARAGDVTAVHQARVASRRLREAIPVVGTVAGPRLLRRATRRVRRLTQALGPVRELDVSLGLLDQVGSAQRGLADAIAATRALVSDERDARRRVMLSALRPAETDAAIAAVRDVRASAGDDDLSWRAVLSARITRRSQTLRSAVDEAGVMYGTEALHGVRIASKKLRYALELAGEARVAGVRRALLVLRDIQDLLGELHDRDVLGRFADEAASGGSPRLASREVRLVGVLQAECLAIHSRYLKLRGRVVVVADDAAGRVAPAVIGLPPSKRPARRLARAG